jgi:NADH dehydrogenase
LIGTSRPIFPIPPLLGYWIGQIIGRLKGDVFITRPEIEGLMANLLYVSSPPVGRTRLTDWVAQHSDTLGRHYTSELARRTDRRSQYQSN